MTIDELIADTVDRPDTDAAEVTGVADCYGSASEAITKLQGGLLCERAQHHLVWFREARCEDMEGPTDKGERLAGTWAGDEEHWSFGTKNPLSLYGTEIRQHSVHGRYSDS